MSFYICHYVILSYKNHQFLSLTLLFCLQKTSVSLCHYVIMSSKKTSVSLRHSVILSSKKTSVSLCHYVILSSKKHLFLFVIMSFCLQKNICLSFSLCHYVFKKHLSHFVIMSFCLQKKHLPPFVIMSFCLQKNICLSFSLCHYVGRQRIQNLDKTVQKKQKRGCVIIDTPSFVMLLPRRGNQFSASFLFLSSICDVFYSNVHISCNNLCITLEVFSVVPLQVAFKSPYRRQS